VLLSPWLVGGWLWLVALSDATLHAGELEGIRKLVLSSVSKERRGVATWEVRVSPSL